MNDWERTVDDNVALVLSGQEIKYDTSFKYLGIFIRNDLKNDDHYISRITSFEKRLSLLNKDDVFTLNEVQTQNASKIITNKLKAMYDLRTRLKSTELLLAHRMHSLIDQIKLMKLQLFVRLYSNSYTKEMLNSLVAERLNQIISNIFLEEIIEISEHNKEDLILVELLKSCSIKLGVLKTNYQKKLGI